MLDSEKNVLNANDIAHANESLKSYTIPTVILSLLSLFWTYALDNQATIVSAIWWVSAIASIVVWYAITLYRMYKTDNVFKEAVNTVIEKVENIDNETKTNTLITS